MHHANEKWSPEEMNFLLKSRKQGYTHGYIGDKLGRTAQACRLAYMKRKPSSKAKKASTKWAMKTLLDAVDESTDETTASEVDDTASAEVRDMLQAARTLLNMAQTVAPPATNSSTATSVDLVDLGRFRSFKDEAAGALTRDAINKNKSDDSSSTIAATTGVNRPVPSA